MIHFGLQRLIYTVNFDASCYYPITLLQKNTKILFGISFGKYSRNSISVSWRPSDRLEQIDLFSDVNMNGINSVTYIGTIHPNKEYEIKIRREPHGHLYWILVTDGDRSKDITFYQHFEYPFIKAGYTIERKYNHKISLQRK